MGHVSTTTNLHTGKTYTISTVQMGRIGESRVIEGGRFKAIMGGGSALGLRYLERELTDSPSLEELHARVVRLATSDDPGEWTMSIDQLLLLKDLENPDPSNSISRMADEFRQPPTASDEEMEASDENDDLAPEPERNSQRSQLAPDVKEQRARQAASTSSAAPPQLSPDGKWWWTGSEWVPANSVSEAPSSQASSASTQADSGARIDTKNLARQHHYIFAFRLLPGALFRDPTLLLGPGRDQKLLQVWDVSAVAARDFSRQSNVPDYVHSLDFNPIPSNGLKCTTITVAGRTAALIEMPTAVRPTEAIWSLVTYETIGGSPAGSDSVGVRYFVLSRAAQALNNVPTNYIAEITPEGRRPLGPVPRMEDAGTEPADRATFRKVDRDMFIQVVNTALGGKLPS